MKTKNYLIILACLFILLGYNVLIYNFANRVIYKDTKNLIGEYFKTEKFDYLRTTINDDNTLNVFIRLENKYYRVRFTNNNYQIIEVNEDIPPYIKKLYNKL